MLLLHPILYLLEEIRYVQLMVKEWELFIFVAFKTSVWAHEYLLCTLDYMQYFKFFFQGTDGVYYIKQTGLESIGSKNHVHRYMICVPTFVWVCECMCSLCNSIDNSVGSNLYAKPNLQLILVYSIVNYVHMCSCSFHYTCSNSGNLTPTIYLLK